MDACATDVIAARVVAPYNTTTITNERYYYYFFHHNFYFPAQLVGGVTLSDLGA